MKAALRLRIGTRPSRLALAQAAAVESLLKERLPGLESVLVPIRSTGDSIRTMPLASVGGKGLFVRELEQALSRDEIDIAVHSMKDLPARLSPEFRIVAVPRREDARDVIFSAAGHDLNELPSGALVGTSSVRRRLELARLRPDLRVEFLRGNVDTRLRRVAEGAFDAAVLALAGLRRLGLAADPRIAPLDEHEFLPAAGQGALALEVLRGKGISSSNEAVEVALRALNDRISECETTAERSFLATLGATCESPVGVRAWANSEGGLKIEAMVFSLDGARWLGDRLEVSAAWEASTCEAAGAALARRMLARGAAEMIHPELKTDN